MDKQTRRKVSKNKGTHSTAPGNGLFSRTQLAGNGGLGGKRTHTRGDAWAVREILSIRGKVRGGKNGSPRESLENK